MNQSVKITMTYESKTKDYKTTFEEEEWVQYIQHKPTGKLIAGHQSIAFHEPFTLTLSLEPVEYQKLWKEKELTICDCGFTNNPHHPKHVSLFLSTEYDDYQGAEFYYDEFEDENIQSSHIEWFNEGAWDGDFEERDDKDWIISDFK